jgi:hypothetical protein
MLADALGELKVFEAAIGGGEPTMHPNFVDILGQFRKRGIVPNFTTRSLSWLRDPRRWPKIIEQAGAFAYSIDSDRIEEDVDDLASVLDYNGIDPERANVQAIIGPGLIDNEAKLCWLLDAAMNRKLRVTLLGYKTTGRGAEFKAKSLPRNNPPGWWVKTIKERADEHKYQDIGIDTVLAAEGQEKLAAAGIPSYMYQTKEGGFSCYIDAVKRKIGPSSYCEEQEMKDCDFEAGNILAAFRGF